MKLEIETTPKALELANLILSQGIDQLESNDKVRQSWRISKTEIKAVKIFREKIVDTLLSPNKPRREDFVRHDPVFETGIFLNEEKAFRKALELWEDQRS